MIREAEEGIAKIWVNNISVAGQKEGIERGSHRAKSCNQRREISLQ